MSDPRERKSSVYLPTVGSDFDFPRRPPGTSPSHKLVFATLPRSGSHFICQKFFTSGRAGLPLEYFNPAHWNRWRVRVAAEAAGQSASDASYLGEWATLADTETPRASTAHTLDALVRRRTGPNGCFSVKMHYSNVAHLRTIVSDAWLREAHWVRIDRLDIIAQAVSLEIAVQTGSWIFTQKVWRQPTYDYTALRRRLIRLLRERHSWSRFFREHGITPHILCYEHFATDPAGHVAAILDKVGLRESALPPDVKLPHIPDIQSQSSTVNALWSERLADDLGREADKLSALAS
ncbi:Stf0 family sulfotransferase [Falsirhodobacter algicola]|uniref:Sulphotransferase Stf0 domain-containing protein n=1 Tax=Falsirhodobacter algicola TaxID=2692330 RepID=A0A8J8MTA9_9RHOB|nr:Stf0 family sulfotransferase [Falsirhodobacter algicola]QUS36330.1 hypothetical protein GR316_08645 [Falsirhodobacter algicola]